MAAWLMGALAWLMGLAWQLREPVLWPVRVYVCACLLACGLLCIWLCRRRRGAWSWVLGLSAVVLLAWSSTGWRASWQMAQRLPASWTGRDVPVIVQVEGLPQAVPGGALFEGRVLDWPVDRADEGGGQAPPCCWPQRLSLRMNTPDGTLPQAGQRWHLAVRLHAPDGLLNPAGFDATLPMFERGIRAVAQVRDRGQAPEKLSDAPERRWQGAIDRLRQRIRTDIMARIPDKRAAGVLAGLSVGDQSAIDREDWAIFRRTGIAHLVSISGAHIAMLGWLAAQLIRRLWARWTAAVHLMAAPDAARWAAVLISALYALLAGWGVPAQRTVWMMLAMAILHSSGRRWPWPLVWLGSAVVVTALDPWALLQPGFWLSYVAVGVLMSSGLSAQGAMRAADAPEHTGALRNLTQRARLAVQQSSWEMMRTQWLVTLALTPLAVVCFQQVSIVSFGANMGAIPLFTLVITPLALLGAVWPPCWDAAAWLIQYAMGRLNDMSALSWAVVQAPALPWWLAAGAVSAGFAMAMPARWSWRMAAVPFFVPLLYLPEPMRLIEAPHPGQFQVLAADIGQGTAVLVRTAKHQLLFDTGPRIGAQSDAGERVLLPLLRAMGVRQLDTLLISHQDADHVGGAASIVKEVPVLQLLSSLDEAHPLRLQAGVDGQRLPHTACLAGQHWTWDGVAFTVLHPTAEDYARRAKVAPNALSCVLRVSRPGQASASALIVGDIEANQEASILARQSADATEASVLRSTVLIAPHHGSKTSSTKAFLQAVQPEQIVIQVGRRNRYGHPSPSVLDRYQAMALNWRATPDCGAYLWNSGEPRQDQSATTAVPHRGSCWRTAHPRYWDTATSSADMPP